MTIIDQASAPVRDISFADPAFLASPWSDLLRLQRDAPIFWSDKQRGWIVSAHADVKAAYADRRLSAARGARLFAGLDAALSEQLKSTSRFYASSVNQLDGRDHIRIRSLLMKAFNAAAVNALQPMIRDTIDELLDRVRPGEAFDFVADIASVLPTRVIQRMLGLPDAWGGELASLAANFSAATAAAALTPQLLLTLDASIARMNDLFATLIDARTRDPGDDVISALVHARDGLSRLTHEELLACIHTIIVGGIETTAHSLGNGLVQLAHAPPLAAHAARGLDDAYALVTELLRYPGTVKCMTRLAVEDFDWHGRSIRRGDVIWIMNAGANVDPLIFDDALIVDPERDNRESMTFSPGIHHCIGHRLTRMELSEFFSRTFARFDVTILDDAPAFVPSFIFRGYRSLRVRFENRDNRGVA